MKKILGLVCGVILGTSLASASDLNYVCDPSIATSTCNYLNGVIAGEYDNTFTNVNASIYIQYGSTSLASTETYLNAVSYANYAAALAANSSDALQASAVASLANDTTPYGGGNVGITVALANALGLAGDALNGGLTGITSGGGACAAGSGGCYNALVTITNNGGTPLYYDNIGGPEPSNAYDFYAAVEHETDEVLGTSSCVSTGGGALSDGCDFFGGTGTPSAVDLFRYNSAGLLAVNSSYLGSGGAPAGAYFSYDGGATNGANGFVYNTSANGTDYADFLNNCPAGPLSVQDARGCPGNDVGLSILNDGGAELNILNAVGYDLATPEPGTLILFVTGLVILGSYRRFRRA